MQAYLFEIRFLAASRDACKNPTELYFLETIMQVETDRWCRNIINQYITLFQVAFTDPALH